MEVTVDRVVQIDVGPESEGDHELIGREEDLERLETLLTDEARFVTLSGPPGVGKTALLTALAERLRGRRFGEVVRPALRAAETVEEVERAVAGALGVETSDRLDDRLEMALSSRGDALLVLDEVDDVIRNDEQRRAFGRLLRGWLGEAPELRIVVSSRLRVRESGEHCYDLSPLDQGAGVELFERRVRRVRDGFTVEESNREAVHAVVEQLDGLPQAIDLAASRCRVLGPGQLLERLRGRGDDTSEDAGLFEPLDRAFDEIWDSLSDWERDAARQLRVFRGRFEPGVAEEVLEIDESGPGALEVLERLFDRSVLQVASTENGRGVRFEMLRTVRRSIDRRSGPLSEAVIRRHAEAYRRRSLEWWRERGSSEAPEAKAALGRAKPQLEAAFERALERDWAIATELASGLVTHLTDVGQFHSAEQVVANLPPADHPRRRALAAYADAFLVGASGDLKEMGERVDEALTFAEEAGDPVLQGRIESLGVLSLYSDAAFEDALDRLERAQQRFREHSGVSDEVKALLQFGRIYRAVGDQRRAERYVRDALEQAERYDLPGRRMRARLHLAFLYAELEQFDAAMEHAEAADAQNDELADWDYEPFVPGVAGSIFHAAGRFSRARPMYEKGIRAKRREGGLGTVADACVGYGLLLLEADEPGRARQEFVESRRLAPASHCRSGFDLFGAQRLGLALSYALEGRLDDAREEIAAAEDRAEELGGSGGERESVDALPQMLEFGRVILELRALRREVDREDASGDELRRRLDGAEERIEETGPVPAASPVLVAVRRLAYRELERARRAIGGDCASEPEGPTLRVAEDFEWMVVDGGEREDLSRRGALRRVLESLVEAHAADPEGEEHRSVYELLEAGWSEQPADPESGKSRVYTTVSRLRELGLEEVLETVEGGYRLHPDLTVEVE